MAQKHGVKTKKASGLGLNPERLKDLGKAIEQNTARGLYDGAAFPKRKLGDAHLLP